MLDWNQVHEAKKGLAELGQRLMREDLMHPIYVYGNISSRCAEYIVLKATGKGVSRVEDFTLVDFNGVPLEEGISPSGMMPVHLEILKNRKDAAVVIHWRGIYADALAGLMDELPMTTEMMYVVQSKVPLVKLPDAVSSLGTLIEWEIGNVREIIASSGECSNAYIVPFLGPWTVAEDLEQAYLRVKVIENSAKTAVLKRLLGVPESQLEAPRWLTEIVRSYVQKIRS